MAKPPKDPKDWKVAYSDQVKEQAAENPEMAEALRDFTSRMRQAMHDFEAGKFSSRDEAMRSIGGEKVDPDEVPEEVMDAMEEMEEEMEKRKKRPQ